MELPTEEGTYLRFAVRDIETGISYYEDIPIETDFAYNVHYIDFNDYIIMFCIEQPYVGLFNKTTKTFEIKEAPLPELDIGLHSYYAHGTIAYGFLGKLYIISHLGVYNFTDNTYFSYNVLEGTLNIISDEYNSYIAQINFNGINYPIELVGTIKNKVILLFREDDDYGMPSNITFPTGYTHPFFWIEYSLTDQTYEYKFYNNPIIKQLSVGVSYYKEGQAARYPSYPAC